MNYRKSLVTKIFVSLILIAIAIVATLVAGNAIFPDAQQAVSSLLKAGANITPEQKVLILNMKISQGIQTVGVFLLPAVIMLWVFFGRVGATISLTGRVNVLDMINVFFLVIFSNSILYVVAQYSQMIPWPQDWISGNDVNRKLTELLLSGKTYTDLGINLLIIAFLPAFGEEFFFRGFLQRVSMKWIKDPHLSIFIVAVIFSAVHFDPVMFIPRFLLGAMLGYLYFWSCSLWLPMFAHFLNNGQYVVASYLVGKSGTSKVAEEGASQFAMDNFYLILSVLLVGMILFSIYARNMKLVITKRLME